MSETILKALMKLFAIIANVNKEGVSDTSRSIVESYLNQQLNQAKVTEYLNLFDEYLAFHHRSTKKKDGSFVQKRTSVNSVKVLMICQQINEELQQEQKALVLLLLLEFISYGAEITDKELDFVKTVSDIFNIEESDYLNSKAFILDSMKNVPVKENILTINKNEKPLSDEFKHIVNNKLNGNIFVLHIVCTNMYIFRYVGEDNLYLNGHIILLNRSYILIKGSAIRGSRINAIYYSDIEGEFLHSKIKSKVIFTAKDVEFRFKNSKNGLHNFNFSEQGGELIGIMGGSGVGKSTLLNILNGNLIPQKGSITINGLDINKNKEKLSGVIGFVPQDDLLIEELTVYQNLYFNAKLCFDDFSETDLEKSVFKILEDLDLIEIKDLTVGDVLNKFISGGQRKRLNIALELIREPSVLFVDEPTSGLSSMDSEIVMDLLKQQALKGKLVIINIHQPSSDIYKMFDKLLILDRGGYLIYYGNPVEAVVYFKTMTNHVNALESECSSCGNVNPEQVLQIVESKVVNEYGKLTRTRKISPTEWNQLYKENIESKFSEKQSEEKLPENKFKIPDKFKQFKIFSIRNILSKLTNRQYMLINFTEAPLLASILAISIKYISGTVDNPNAYVFSENINIPIYMFMCILTAMFIGLTVSAEEIIKDRQLLKREKFLHLSRFSYINSKVLIMFVLSAIQTISFIIVGNLIMGIKGMTLAYWLILFSTSCFANILGLNISSALNSVVTIYILIPFIIVPQILFNGTTVRYENLNKFIGSYKYVPVMGDLMTSRWAYEAMAVHQFKNNKFDKKFFYFEKEKSNAAFKNSFLIPTLQTKIENCQRNIGQNIKDEKTIKDLKIIKNEINLLSKQNTENGFKYLDSLNINSFNNKISLATQKYLRAEKRFYIKRFNQASDNIDFTYEELIEKLGGKQNVDKLKNEYHNICLDALLKNKQDLHKIYETNDRLIQMMDPIYKNPESNYGRAHFYAPEKNVFGLSIDTFWFDILVIWLFVLVLYFTLLYDLLRKVIEGFGNVKFKVKR
ncbi:MAG: ATP-binding cassette domain-containing protein [Bacteroidales bacterium]|nr:ATP-binding cassette domain-containing protein [Bacteroidales bacterium]